MDACRLRARHASSASSVSAKSGPRSVAYTESSSSGHSIAASALRSAITSSRSWNERPPTSTCGMRRASSARCVGARDVVAEVLEAPEQEADVARGRRGTRSPRSSHRPAALADQPVDERADRVGQRLLDLPRDDLAEVAVRARRRQRDDRGLRRLRRRAPARAARSAPGCGRRRPASRARTRRSPRPGSRARARKLVAQVARARRRARAGAP